MLVILLNLIFGKPGSTLSAYELEVSRSLRRLKTLTFVDGRVSIDPSEVLTPQYLAERREARRFLTS